MIAPVAAFKRVLIGLALGCALGIFYGFLRPARRKRGVPADLIFVLFAGWVYLYYGFAVCRGDLRMGYLLPPILGGIGWDKLFGGCLHPVFVFFWALVAKTSAPFQRFLKKLWIFIKFLFASGKKWGKIKGKERELKKPSSKGVCYGTQE